MSVTKFWEKKKRAGYREFYPLKKDLKDLKELPKVVYVSVTLGNLALTVRKMHY